MRIDGPMVLHEDSRLLIASIKLAATGKVDRANFYFLIIEHGDRLCIQLPLVIRICKRGAKLNFVYTKTVDGFKRPQFIPFKAAGMPLLVRKIVSAVAGGKNGHTQS